MTDTLRVLPRPKTVIEDNIRSQFQRPTRDRPELSLDSAVPSIVFWVFLVICAWAIGAPLLFEPLVTDKPIIRL